jgi:hypothetical protein
LQASNKESKLSATSWVREGQRIMFRYYDTACTGVVTMSRVKYGGAVQHTVELDMPIKLPWRTTEHTRVLADEENIVVLEYPPGSPETT